MGVSSSLLAQSDSTSTKGNETKKDSVYASKDLKKRMDLFYVDLTWDYLIGMPGSVKQQFYGHGVNLGLMYDQPLNKRSNVSLAIGAGFQSHNYFTDATVINIDSTQMSMFQVQVPAVKEKGKLSLNYIDVPFEVRFRTNPNKHDFRWKFAVGAKVGYLIQAHDKIINDQGEKVKYYTYPYINQWRYGVTAKVGYGSVMLSGFYSLSELFSPSNTTQHINALTLGISIVPF